MLDLLITILILVAICAILWWAVGALGLPEPIRIVLIVVMAIIALIILFGLLPGHGGGLKLR